MKQYSTLGHDFEVRYSCQVHFTSDLFDYNNSLLRQIITGSGADLPAKILYIIDEGVSHAHEYLLDEIAAFMRINNNQLSLAGKMILPGGEHVKNQTENLKSILEEIDMQGLSHQSFIVAVGGGALLDMAGFAAAIAHNGVRLISVPTTVLSQSYSGTGGESNMNWHGKKSFLGTFAPPFAVINDWNFLRTLEDRDWISGISEALRVALTKDPDFFDQIHKDAEALKNRDLEAMEELIYRCVRLQLEPVGGESPAEKVSLLVTEPGHWAVPRLEQLSNFEIRYGEAVAIGIAIDVTYARLQGMIGANDHDMVINTLEKLGFDLFIPSHITFEDLYEGIAGFRKDYGSTMNLNLIAGIGIKKDVHEIDKDMMKDAVRRVRNRMFVNQF